VFSSSITADRRARVVILALSAGAWLIARGLFALWPDLFVPWDAKASDRLFVLRSNVRCAPRPCDGTVTHVDLTYSMLRAMPDSRVTRADYARVVSSLATAGVAAQVFDFVFASKTTDEDDGALARAAAAAGHVYFGSVFHLSPPGAAPPDQADQEVPGTTWTVALDGKSADSLPAASDPIPTIPELARSARGTGFLNLEADRDGVFRRVPLLLRYRNAYVPSMALRVACDYLDVKPQDVVLTPRRRIRLRNARYPGESNRRDVVVPLDGDNNLRINFIGPWEAFEHVGFREVWRAARDPVGMEVLKQTHAGRIAIVADISTGATDVGPVPVDSRYPLAGVHATVLQNILNRSFVREANGEEMLAIEWTLLVILAFAAMRLGSRGIALTAAALAGGYLAATGAMFWYVQLIPNIVRPMLALGIGTFGIIIYRFVHEENARAILRESFAAYFPPGVVDRIVRNPELIMAIGQRKELTILFSDIKGFTTRCQTMSPDEIRTFLNEYFSDMVEIVFDHGGTVDKFIGDGLMVFFGDPDDQSDHALRAVECAKAMQVAVRRLSDGLEKDGRPPFAIRIGVNTGIVAVGNMGSSRRLSYTVLGADVNLAQRLESNAPVGGILIARRTEELIRGRIPTVERGTIAIKGLGDPVAVYEVPIDATPVILESSL
jgi:adenylate cyclase